MRLSVFLILFSTQCVYSTTKTETTTLRIDMRVQLLKAQLRNSLRHPSIPEPVPDVYDASDEYAQIPPIMDRDALKRNDKYWLKPIKNSKVSKPALRSLLTTKRSSLSLPSWSDRAQTISNATSQKPKGVEFKNVTLESHFTAMQSNTTKVPSPVMLLTTGSWSLDIFYRKSFPFLNTPLPWLHCTELITPFIRGVKKNLGEPKRLQPKDHIVQRLLHLLTHNTTKLSRAEKRSIMYQVSKLNIRLFSWSVAAMQSLMGAIMTAGKSTDKTTFAGLKRGIQAILDSWTTDLSNTTTILLQSRIYRPPCVQPHEEGSSKFVRGSTVPSRPTSPKSSVETCMFRAYGEKNDNCP